MFRHKGHLEYISYLASLDETKYTPVNVETFAKAVTMFHLKQGDGIILGINK